MARILPICAVMAGGAVGAVTRVLLTDALTDATQTAFPLAILITNVLGSCLLGMLSAVLTRSGTRGSLLYALLGTGFLGGFTTFSTFAVDTFSLWRQGSMALAALNLVLNGLLCVLAVGLGYAGVTMVGPRRTNR